jgi:purine-binding chemotaxis protein CheW
MWSERKGSTRLFSPLNFAQTMSKYTASDPSSKYVIFNLGLENFAISIHRVREIVPYPTLQIPTALPDFLDGCFTNRGRVVPVLDLRKRFNIKSEHVQPKRIIILTVQNYLFGIMVDSISEIITIESSFQEKIPADLKMDREWYPEDYLLKMGESLLLVLTPDKLLTPSEIEALIHFNKEWSKPR